MGILGAQRGAKEKALRINTGGAWGPANGTPHVPPTRWPTGFISGVGGLMALFLAAAVLRFSVGPPVILRLARRWSAK